MGYLYARDYNLLSTRWIIRIHRTRATVTQIQLFGYCNSGVTVFQQPGTGNGTLQLAGTQRGDYCYEYLRVSEHNILSNIVTEYP